jgi:hypothetical protein
MIVTVDGKRVAVSPETQAFIEGLTERAGTPANEVLAAIINGHQGRW